MKLKIAYLYSEELNLYGDTGNVEILAFRAKARGIDTEISYIDSSTKVDAGTFSEISIVFMGGGPDAGQKQMYRDFIVNKGIYLKDYVENGGVSLFICGAYQLMGHYYKSADGSILDGLGVFDIYTEHFGRMKNRCVGNIVCSLDSSITTDPVFQNINTVGNTIVGFENHGGRTFLSENNRPFAKVLKGSGNNSEDFTEGVYFKNSIGTYLHGPILSKNPHIADFLIAKGLKMDTLGRLDDKIIVQAHTALINRFK